MWKQLQAAKTVFWALHSRSKKKRLISTKFAFTGIFCWQGGWWWQLPWGLFSLQGHYLMNTLWFFLLFSCCSPALERQGKPHNLPDSVQNENVWLLCSKTVKNFKRLMKEHWAKCGVLVSTGTLGYRASHCAPWTLLQKKRGERTPDPPSVIHLEWLMGAGEPGSQAAQSWECFVLPAAARPHACD